MDNKKEASAMMYGFFLLIAADILFLIFAKKKLEIPAQFLYSIFLIIFAFCIWKIATIRILSLEVSEHVLSVKYNHPWTTVRRPALEIPMYKVASFKIEKTLIDYKLIVTIKTRKGLRSFFYKAGILYGNNVIKLNHIAKSVRSSRLRLENKQ
ncbi:hypothetical protein [Epilithonimonas mollis]|uniref:DUF304 domain-containing protein n=1 Tax=Epilithonimonas mollis TaxID=216903 RepID=A0A1M6NEE9_9FLAO|nr:hypothetical protein [Epilithonimonas mollis]SHJ94118.1 hypothetical protein SAMN05444371_0375 [Epilithonimonas mollis]